VDAACIATLCTKSAGDALDGIPYFDPSEPLSEIRWEGIYAFAVFSLLAILPFPWWAIRERRRASPDAARLDRG
jgi:hypothetical protein